MALNNLGVALAEVGRLEEAMTALHDIATIFRETGDRHREGMALGNLGAANELAAIYAGQGSSTIQRLEFRDAMNQDQIAFSEMQQYMAFNQSRAASIGNFIADTYNEMRAVTNKEIGSITQNLRAWSSSCTSGQGTATDEEAVPSSHQVRWPEPWPITSRYCAAHSTQSEDPPGWAPCRVGASQVTGPPLHPQGHPKILSNRSAESILRPHPCARSLCEPWARKQGQGETCPGPARGPHPPTGPFAWHAHGQTIISLSHLGQRAFGERSGGCAFHGTDRALTYFQAGRCRDLPSNRANSEKAAVGRGTVLLR